MRIPAEFDTANKRRRERENYNTCRHFVLWAKLHYKGKSLEDIVCKITGVDRAYIDFFNKVYWLKKSCKLYNVEGYEIINNFIRKSDNLFDYDNELEQMVFAMRAELQGLNVKCNEGKLIWDLGEADLFEEE